MEATDGNNIPYQSQPGALALLGSRRLPYRLEYRNCVWNRREV